MTAETDTTLIESSIRLMWAAFSAASKARPRIG
jgi:hypothetical protein